MNTKEVQQLADAALKLARISKYNSISSARRNVIVDRLLDHLMELTNVKE